MWGLRRRRPRPCSCGAGDVVRTEYDSLSHLLNVEFCLRNPLMGIEKIRCGLSQVTGNHRRAVQYYLTALRALYNRISDLITSLARQEKLGPTCKSSL